MADILAPPPDRRIVTKPSETDATDTAVVAVKESPACLTMSKFFIAFPSTSTSKTRHPTEPQLCAPEEGTSIYNVNFCREEADGERRIDANITCRSAKSTSKNATCKASAAGTWFQQSDNSMRRSLQLPSARSILLLFKATDALGDGDHDDTDYQFSNRRRFRMPRFTGKTTKDAPEQMKRNMAQQTPEPSTGSNCTRRTTTKRKNYEAIHATTQQRNTAKQAPEPSTMDEASWRRKHRIIEARINNSCTY